MTQRKWSSKEVKHWGCVGCGRASLVAQMVKNLPAMQETQVWSLGREDPLEKGMATHSVFLPGESPWTEGPGGLQPMGLQWVGRDWMAKHTQSGHSCSSHPCLRALGSVTFHPLIKRWSRFLLPFCLSGLALWPAPTNGTRVCDSLSGLPEVWQFLFSSSSFRTAPAGRNKAGLLDNKKLPERRPGWWSSVIARHVSEANGDHPAIVRTSENGSHVNDPRRGQKNCPTLSDQHRLPPGWRG